MPRIPIVLKESTLPPGPFSLGVTAEPFIFLSGQIGLDPRTGKLVAGGIGEECRQIFRNIEAVLKAAGKSFDDVIKATVFLVDMKEWPAMNEIYAAQFKAPHPARTSIGVAALPMGARVEIEVIAR